MKNAFLSLALLASVACGVDLSKLPPIVVVAPAVTAPSPPAEAPPPAPPVVEPAPDPAPPPVVEPPPAPFVDLTIHVHRIVSASPSLTAPIPSPWCVINGEKRNGDGSGFIHFPVTGVVVAECGAAAFLTRYGVALQPGPNQVTLYPVPAPPAPTPPPAAPPASTEIRPGTLSIAQVVDIAQRVHNQEGWNLGASSSRETRNRFWARVVGVVHFGHPLYNRTADARWHIKDGGNGRPQSDDVVVLMPSREFWDCIPGAGANGYSFRASFDGILPADQNVYAPPRPNPGVVKP